MNVATRDSMFGWRAVNIF